MDFFVNLVAQLAHPHGHPVACSASRPGQFQTGLPLIGKLLTWPVHEESLAWLFPGSQAFFTTMDTFQWCPSGGSASPLEVHKS